MMGSRRTNETDEPPTYVNPLVQANNIAPNIQSARSVTFQEGNVSAGHFEFVPYTPLVVPGWENIHSMNQPVTQRITEMSGNPFMNPSSFQNPQVNLNFNTAIDLPEAPLLPEWNTNLSPQYINQGHNAISTSGTNDGVGIDNFENPWSSKNPTIARNFAGDFQMNRQAGESKFGPFNRPKLDADFVHSPLHYRPQIHTRNNVNLNTNQSGVQGKVEGSFLSLGIGGTKEAIPRSQQGNREISDKLKEAASAELKMARARKAMGQTLDANFAGLHRNTSGFTTFSNQMGHVDRMTSTNNEVAVHSTPNSGLGSTPYHNLEMQHGISRNNDSNSNFPSSMNISRHGSSNHHRVFVGNQAVHPGTLGGNSTQSLNSHQYGFNRVAPPESGKPSWTMSTMSHTPSQQLQNVRFKTGNSLPSESSMTSPSLGLGSSSTRQNYTVKHQTPTQGPGGGVFSQRTAVPQVSWVSSGQAVTDLPFTKRLGVEFKGRDSPQAAERHLAPRGTSLQTTSTGQMCKYPNRGSTHPPDNFLRPSIDHGAPVNQPLNSQESYFTHGQSQDAPVKLSKHPQVQTPPTTSVDGISMKSPYHKRTAVAPPPSPHWVQRQKIHHSSMPIRLPTKPNIPVTTALVHPSIPLAQSHTQRVRPVAAPINPSIPCTSSFRPHVPVTTAAPIVLHITRKDPDTTPPLTRYKCLLCKRDLALTSEGAVYQPTVPPPVAVLPCGHTFHDQCLQKITPKDQAKDPPCIPCAIGEN
ncbi:hypothetical protein L2E82_27502 [Cichorium intybus]|uniref:Uncharacterized protein n=1 Tax=Cichorium intybus TaxID=13427 RepID=A0ACB9CT21_CICIN|nr:hypothetical protein L2E82_27502 [Cichorium intybus]